MRMLMNYVLDAGHCICAVFFGNEKDGYRYVLGSRQQDVREMAKEFNKKIRRTRRRKTRDGSGNSPRRERSDRAMADEI